MISIHNRRLRAIHQYLIEFIEKHTGMEKQLAIEYEQLLEKRNRQ